MKNNKKQKHIDCHKCANYEIESEGKWSFGICGIDRKRELDPDKCKDFYMVRIKRQKK